MPQNSIDQLKHKYILLCSKENPTDDQRIKLLALHRALRNKLGNIAFYDWLKQIGGY